MLFWGINVAKLAKKQIIYLYHTRIYNTYMYMHRIKEYVRTINSNQNKVQYKCIECFYRRDGGCQNHNPGSNTHEFLPSIHQVTLFSHLYRITAKIKRIQRISVYFNKSLYKCENKMNTRISRHLT